MKLSTMILQEASKADQKILDEIERDQVATDYQDTLAGLQTVGSISFPATEVPIIKDECGECGECGECNESYMVEYDMLYKFMEANNFDEEHEAHNALCEAYNLEPIQLVVVAECDDVNKGLLANALKTGELGVPRRYCSGLCNLLNHGIRVMKKG